MEDSLKKCPFCAEEIQAEAVVCRFCNRSLAGRENRAKEIAQSLASSCIRFLKKENSLSIIALAVSLFALVHGPITIIGLRAYDFTTPKAALTSVLKMQVKSDYRAMEDLNSAISSPRAEEKLRTLEVKKEVPFKDRMLLFISYTEDGATKREVEGYEKDSRSGIWRERYVSKIDVKEQNPILANDIEAWTERGVAP